jgi:hypothetical protein
MPTETISELLDVALADPALGFREEWTVSRSPIRPLHLDFRLMALPVDFDPDYHVRRDGEWPKFVVLPHEAVEFEGHTVPAFDLDAIDPERAAWEEARRGRRPDICGR